MEGFVKTKINNKGIAEITFFHPKSNSLPRVILHSLAEQIYVAGKNNNIKIIILKSEGEKIFCAGAAFDELINISSAEEGKQFFMGFAHVIEAIRKTPKIVISRVQNRAVGGGVGLICASDYAVATRSSSLKLSELNLGIAPFVIGPVIEKKIGQSLCLKLTLETDWIDAEWGLKNGIYAKVFLTIKELDDYIETFAHHLASKNTEVLEKIKNISWKGYENLGDLLEERAQMSGELIISPTAKKIFSNLKSHNSRK